MCWSSLTIFTGYAQVLVTTSQMVQRTVESPLE